MKDEPRRIKLTDAEYLRDITNAFSCGQDRYWIHGFSYPQMRQLRDVLRTNFPDAQLHEYSDLDVCVFCRSTDHVAIKAMEQIAHRRVKLISQGRTRNLPT